MKTQQIIKAAAVGLLATAIAVPAFAADGKSIFELGAAEKPQTSKDFKGAPSKIDTNFGTLEFQGGAYPTKATVDKVYEELDRQRATQLYLDLFPALSVHGILKGQVRDLGVRSSSDILVTPTKMNSTPLWLTGNTDSIYAWMTLDLKADGPTVMEIPPNLMGPLDDANFRFVVDFGATGPDKGKGGKYLILPPDYEGDVPDGYFVARSPTYRNWALLRGNTDVIGTGDKAFDYYKKNLKIYPLKSGPRKGNYIDAGHMPTNTLVPEDWRAFEWLHEIISYEPQDVFNIEQRGKLASLGIEKGKPFNPDARMKKILDEAAKQAVAMARVITFASRDPDVRLYPGTDLSWETPFIGGSSEFTKNGYRNLDARTLFHYNAIVITPAMAAPIFLGKNKQSARESLITFMEGEVAAVRWKQWRIYPKQFIASAGNPSLMGVGGYRAEGMGYPSIYNIARDPREQWNQVAVSAFVLGPYMKIVGEYQKSLEKYPNPPAFSMTKFAK